MPRAGLPHPLRPQEPMARRPLPTGPADWLILAVTPALLVGMVSALLFFILAVFYRGEFNERLHWILFAGVVGMVLIGRIHLIEEISRRAGFYSGILGLLVVIALIRFVPPPLGWPPPGHYAFCAALVALGFWATRLLVADTTDIHSETEIGGEGLLRAAGLEDDPAARLRRDVERRTGPDSPHASKQKRANQEDGEGEDEAEQIRSNPNRRRAPGVAIVWFSALALPVFGIGQGFIPAEELKTRWYTLMLLVGYLGCAFLLLLTSCFLGFRRYLARRGLSMPAGMAAIWILGGMLLVGCVLLVALVIPRPSDIGPLQTLSALAGKKIEPIRKEQKQPESSQGTPQNAGKEMDARRDDAKGMEKASPDAEKDAKQPGNRSEKSETKGGGKTNGKSAQGKGGAKGGEGKAGQADNQGGKDQKGAAGKAGSDPKNAKGQEPSAKGQSPDKTGLGEGKKAADKNGPGSEPKDKANESSRQPETSPPPPPDGSNASQFAQAIRTLLKMMFAGLAVGVALAFAITCLSLGWSPTETLNRWLAWLQGLFKKKAQEGVWSPEGPSGEVEPLPGFLDIPDPFSGRRPMPAGGLVRLTFRAVQAWGNDAGDPMLAGETPNEYFRRLGSLHPILEEGLDDFARWHDLSEYAKDAPLDDCREPVRELWRAMRNGSRGRPATVSGAP